MGKIVSIDFGKHRIGIAYADEDLKIAVTYAIVETERDLEKTLSKLIDKLQPFYNDISFFIIGLPLLLSGKESDMVMEVKRFGSSLQKKTNIPVQYFDERLTSAKIEKELKQLHVDLVLTDPEVAHRIQLVLPQIINSEDELNSYEEKCLSDGYEGVMIRKPDGKYKCGRSTEREGILLKIKRFKDAEAEVIGFKEKLHNVNEQEKNEFGLAKRSSKKAGMVPAGTLGTLLVRDLKTNIEFGIGSGMDDEIRQKIWDNRDDYINKFVKYKYQNVGIKEAPRFPVFLGFRHTNDMS